MQRISENTYEYDSYDQKSNFLMLEIEEIIKNDVNVKKSLEILEREKCNLLKQTRLRQNFLLLHALLLLLLPSFRKSQKL